MKSYNPSQKLLKKRLFGMVAFFLLLYTVADVSVLEYYCGNEALGITSFQVLAKSQTTDDKQKVTSFLVKASRQAAPDNSPQDPLQHDDCICSCAHILLSCNYLEPTQQETVIFNRQTYSSFPDLQHSESHLPYLFRPPRKA